MYRRLGVVSQSSSTTGATPTDHGRDAGADDGDPDQWPCGCWRTWCSRPRDTSASNCAFGDFTPLNRLDDAVPPESETARVFDGIARRIAGGKATPEDWQQA